MWCHYDDGLLRSKDHPWMDGTLCFMNSADETEYFMNKADETVFAGEHWCQRNKCVKKPRRE